MIRFQFVEDHRDTHEVKQMCKVLGIQRSSFYKWQAASKHARRGKPPTTPSTTREYWTPSDG